MANNLFGSAQIKQKWESSIKDNHKQSFYYANNLFGSAQIKQK